MFILTNKENTNCNYIEILLLTYQNGKNPKYDNILWGKGTLICCGSRTQYSLYGDKYGNI